MNQSAEVGVGERSPRVRSVTRALQVLSLLSTEHEDFSLRQAVDITALPRTTVIRLLDTLEEEGLLWANGNNSYSAGPTLLRWAGLATELWRLPVEARDALQDLAEGTKETASVYVRQSTRRVCVALHEGPSALRHVTRVGSDHPLWAGAPAKVLLIDADDDVINRVANESPGGMAMRGSLIEGRDEAKSLGYSVSHGEREDGLSIVSVPIHGQSGRIVAALAVTGPTARFGPERVPGLLNHLQKCAPLFSQWRIDRVAELLQDEAKRPGQQSSAMSATRTIPNSEEGEEI